MIEGSRLLAVAACALALSACGGGNEKKDDPAPARQAVTAATVTLQNQPRLVNASGSIDAWEEVPVGSETGGLVATGVFTDEGRYVRQGQVLVKLNDDLLRAQLAQQQASVQSAEANLAERDANLGRARELNERGFLSQASLDTAIAQQRTAAAGLAQARAALSETRTRLGQTEVRAPVSGLIISRSVTRGEIVGAGTELFRMARDGRLELNAQVPETELPLVRAGQGATVTSDQAGSTSGVIRIVTPEVDPQTRLGVARISLPNPGALRPGMFARATINIGDQPALTIPADAVVFRDGRPGVYVLNARNAAAFTPVITGPRVGGVVAVTSGLSAGQRVVAQGAGFLGDGDVVNVTAAAAATARPAAASAPVAPAARTAG